MVTRALVSAAPFGSVTTPRTLPVVCCAAAGAAKHRAMAATLSKAHVPLSIDALFITLTPCFLPSLWQPAGLVQKFVTRRGVGFGAGWAPAPSGLFETRSVPDERRSPDARKV